MAIELKEASVLVTGGSGLIGSHVVDRLLAGGAARVEVVDRVVNEDNLASAIRTGRVGLHELDVRDRAALAHVVSGADAIVHLAAMLMRHGRATPRETVEVNVLGTYDLCELALDHGVRRFVLGSSIGVYGQPDTGRLVDEDAPIRARSIYGGSKFSNELFCRALKEDRGLEYVALRYASTYGARMSRNGYFPRLIFDTLDQIDSGASRIVLEGDPGEVHDFLYVTDAADATVLAIEAPCEDVAINVVNAGSVEYGEIAQTLLDICGVHAELEWRPRDFVYVTERRFSGARAQELLGFQAHTDLRTGLERFVAWRTSQTRAAKTMAGS